LSEGSGDRRSSDLYDVIAKSRAGLEELGLRERHKIDKLERISAAAHKLFARDGYEATTLREIAREAEVALGTLSLYANDKRDLILLIFNRLIPPLLEQGLRNARGAGSLRLASSLIGFFEPFYRAYAKNVTLYRIVLGQIYGGSASVHAVENNVIRSGLIDNLSSLISRAVVSGECAGDIDLATHARSFYFLYFAAVRAWLGGDEPDPEEGLADLRTLFEQHIEGLRPRP